jgi:hypothetical protein
MMKHSWRLCVRIKSNRIMRAAHNNIDMAWSIEVERRSQELDKGKARLIPGEEVFEKIKKRKNKHAAYQA